MSTIDIAPSTSTAFTMHLGQFANPKGEHLLDRTQPLGDWLDLSIVIESVGRSSIKLATEATSSGEKRFAVDFTQVLTCLKTMRPQPWPAEWRQRLLSFAPKETSA